MCEWFTLWVVRKQVSSGVQIILEKHEPIRKIASASKAVTNENGAWVVHCVWITPPLTATGVRDTEVLCRQSVCEHSLWEKGSVPGLCSPPRWAWTCWTPGCKRWLNGVEDAGEVLMKRTEKYRTPSRPWRRLQHTWQVSYTHAELTAIPNSWLPTWMQRGSPRNSVKRLDFPTIG